MEDGPTLEVLMTSVDMTASNRAGLTKTVKVDRPDSLAEACKKFGESVVFLGWLSSWAIDEQVKVRRLLNPKATTKATSRASYKRDLGL